MKFINSSKAFKIHYLSYKHIHFKLLCTKFAGYNLKSGIQYRLINND